MLSSRAPRRLILTMTLLGSSLPVFGQQSIAQQSGVMFKHLRQYPAGQWSTVSTSTRGSVVSQPITTTTCSSPVNPIRQGGISAGSISAALGCKSEVLRDEERTAEYRQVCNGAVVQTISVTLQAVNDTTVKSEMRSVFPGYPETVVRSTAHYLGACPANQAVPTEAAAPPSMKISPEDCAEVSSMRKQAEEGLKGCDTADLPETMRAPCKTRLQSTLKVIEQMEHSCGR